MSIVNSVGKRVIDLLVRFQRRPEFGRSTCQLVMWKASWTSTHINTVKYFGLCALPTPRCSLQKKLLKTPVLFFKYNHADVVHVHGRCFSIKPAVEERSDFVDKHSAHVCKHTGLSSDCCSCSWCLAVKASKIPSDTVKDATVEIMARQESTIKPDQVSTTVQPNDVPHVSSVVADPVEPKKPGLLKRFKMMYKQYGIIMFCVHWSTASVWTAMFYYAAISGVDVVPLLKWMGASDAVIKPFLLPSVGHAAVTYLLYKLATPARYTVTLAGTQLAVKYMRKWGYLKEPPADDSLRSLVSDSRAIVKDKMEVVRDKVEDKMEEVRDKIEVVRDKVEDRFDDIRDEMHELKYKLNDRIDIVRDKVEDRIDDLRDEVKGKLNNIRAHIGENQINATVKQHKM